MSDSVNSSKRLMLTSALRRECYRVFAHFYATLDEARAKAGMSSKRRTQPVSRGYLSPRQIALDHYTAQMNFDDEARNSDHR
jgi:hypothetical protein